MSELAGQAPGPSCIALSDELLGCVVLVAGDGTIVDISPAAESLLGWSPDEIRGEAIDVLLPEPVRTQHSRHVSDFLAASERPATRRLHSVARHLDGREIPVDIELRPLLIHGDRYVAAVLTDATTDRSARLIAAAHARTAIGQELKSADGRFLEVNSASCQLVGYEEAELLHMRIQDVLHPDDLAIRQDAIAKLLTGAETSVVIDVRIERKGGAEIWLRKCLTLIRGTSSGGDRILSQSVDITDEKNALDRVRRNADLALVLAESSGSLSTFGADLSPILETLAANVVTKLDGTCGVFLVRGDDWVLDCATWQGTDPNHRDDALVRLANRPQTMDMEPVATAFRTHKSVFIPDVEALQDTAQMPSEHLQEFVDQGVSSAIVSPILVRDGVAGVITCRRYAQQPPYTEDDIAFLERLAERAALGLLNSEAHNELAESESRYRLLAENATDVVYQLDARSRLKWASPSIGAVLGWRPEQLIGVDAIELAHPDDIATVLSWRRKLFDGTDSPKFEVRMRCADGATKWMSLQARPTRDDAGSINGVIVGLRDVDEEVRAREQAARVERTFRLAMNGAPQGMSVTGLDLGFLQVNPALCSMLGRDEAWLLAHNVRDVVHPADLEQDLARRGELLNGRGEASVQECRWLRADGSEIWVNHSMGLLRGEHEQPLFYVSHVQDNTAAHQARAELSYRATHDALTGLINREHVHERIAGVLGQVSRRGGPAGLLFCDLDNFKQVNDSYGHDVGDHVLRITADRIVSVLRGSDIVARLGGDEFVVMLTEVQDLTAAIAVAEKIREAVAAPIILDDQHLNITISVGVALAVPDADVALLLRSADGALYEAKEGGRDRVATFAGTQEGHRAHGYDERP